VHVSEPWNGAHCVVFVGSCPAAWKVINDMIAVGLKQNNSVGRTKSYHHQFVNNRSKSRTAAAAPLCEDGHMLLLFSWTQCRSCCAKDS
jgi:hypothetical protein